MVMWLAGDSPGNYGNQGNHSNQCNHGNQGGLRIPNPGISVLRNSCGPLHKAAVITVRLKKIVCIDKCSPI
jgi:hypothetical protein